jgi:hypothetical protein
MSLLRYVLAALVCTTLFTVSVNADEPVCDPACDPHTATLCGVTTGGNKCIPLISGSCTLTSDCHQPDDYTLTCWTGLCWPTQWLPFDCGADKPCTDTEVCSKWWHGLGGVVDDSTNGFCVQKGGALAPCTATTECDAYTGLECKSGYCQPTGYDIPGGGVGGVIDSTTACTTDSECGVLGCNTVTHYCRTFSTTSGELGAASNIQVATGILSFLVVLAIAIVNI